ncbi:MAG: carbohydrate kinase [Planctomycetaceae bacterium]|jgi:L-xylulokinase|nr:carbohydrate kinase [Planctomycetaceae bacterium]
MSRTYLIGVDCGSTMVKAAIFDADGKEYASAGKKIEHIYLHAGWTENDMDVLWDSVCCVLREVLLKSRIDAASVVSVTCTGHGNGLYLVADDDKPARNGIISSDARARKYIEEWTASNVLDKILPKTMQSLWAAQPNALLRWLVDNEPETVRRTKYLFMVKDFIRYRLTGEAYMELSDMSATSLIDVGSGDYDDEVLATWGLLELKRIMPPIRRSADVCGKITREASALTGLVEGTPVAGGMFDIDACGLAVGMTDESRFCMVAGTWGNNQFISGKPIIDRDVFMTSCYSVDGYYLVLEGSATSASNLEWFVTQFFEGDKELLKIKGMTKSIYEHCSELVSLTDATDTGITFIPFLYGNPVDLDAKACLFGLDGRHTREQVMRAVFEGVVFGHRWHTERLLRFIDKPETIRLTGGAVNSDVWAQMFADILQIPIEIPAGTELGCFGASICGAVAVGLYKSYKEACEKMVKVARSFKPDAGLAEVYNAKYYRYKKLLETLAPVWKELKPAGKE